MEQPSSSPYRRVVIILCGTAGVAITGAALLKYVRNWLRRAASSNLEQNIENGKPVELPIIELTCGPILVLVVAILQFHFAL